MGILGMQCVRNDASYIVITDSPMADLTVSTHVEILASIGNDGGFELLTISPPLRKVNLRILVLSVM